MGVSKKAYKKTAKVPGDSRRYFSWILYFEYVVITRPVDFGKEADPEYCMWNYRS
jgi:hypothetical protein